MSTRLSRPEQTQRNRSLVLKAARQVFLARGYHGATLERIADEAGFSKGVVYSQFVETRPTAHSARARKVTVSVSLAPATRHRR